LVATPVEAKPVLDEEFIGTDEQATDSTRTARGARRLIICISPYFSEVSKVAGAP
jgi:hypothetical protein